MYSKFDFGDLQKIDAAKDFSFYTMIVEVANIKVAERKIIVAGA